MQHVSLKNHLIIVLIACLLSSGMTASVVLMSQAQADQNANTDDVPRYIPYNGTLEYNGEALSLTGNDAPWLRFEVTDGFGGDVVLQQDVQAEVYSGKFSVMLGFHDGANSYVQSGDITTAVSNADELYLSITVLNSHNPSSPDVDTGGDNVALSNPQRLLMTPFSVWATHATDFDVAQALEVGTSISAGGAISGASLTTTGAISGSSVGSSGTITADADVEAGALTFKYAEWAEHGTGDGGASIYNDSGSYDALMIVGNDLSGDRRIEMYDDVYINDQLTVKGNINDSDGDVYINDGLQVVNDIVPSAGSTDANGINFPNNPGGGSGDDAWIRYYAESGEDMALEIGIANDAADDIKFNVDGGERMSISGTTTTVNNNLVIGGTLDADELADVDTTSTDGCAKIGNIQMCWGEITISSSGTPIYETLQKSFANDDYGVSFTSIQSSDAERSVALRSQSTTQISVEMYNGNGNSRTGSVSYLAIGEAGSSW